MKRYKKWATVGVALSIVGILTGCGSANNTTGGTVPTNTSTTTNTPSNTVPGTNTTGAITTNTKTNTETGSKTNGQGVGTGSAPAYVLEISWHGKVYYVSKNISQIGNQIGVVEEKITEDHVLNSNKTISNFAPVGTKLFSVPGKSTSEAIAFEYSKGRYWEAVAYKNQ